jgi:2-polyprenyl-3-methyl-5-hydroxy-6-metoxy-1,4-benzoquinol methylase
LFLKTKDLNRKISNKEFIYLQCQACWLIFLSEIPADLGSYYTDEYYKVPSFEKLKKIARAERYKIKMVQKFVKSGALLEIGAAFGVFAYQAKEAGYLVDAIEMDGRCCDYLANKIGVNAIKSDAPHNVIANMKKHDVIAMWHVLEHLPNPWECLRAMAENLTPGGILVVATPNPESFQFRIMGGRWPHVDAPRHINLIPIKVLKEFLKPLGLEDVMSTTDDAGGRSWNRFGWQRYLMNLSSGKLAQSIYFLAGYILSFPMALWDRRKFNGCAYTAIFRKRMA